MADVGGPARTGSRHRDRSRGQLILVTALALAILFVALALILNTAIYTENLATRSGDIGGATDAVRYHDAARDATVGVIGYVNAHNNSSHTELRTTLDAGVEAFRNNSARQFATGDRAVEATLNETVNGTRIAQSDQSRNFTNASGTTDWTVVEDVERTRAYEINVTSTDPLIEIGLADTYRIVADNGSDTWRMNVTESTVGGEVVVGVRNAAGDEFTCNGGPAPVVINVSAGTVGGTPCDGLAFAEGVGGTYAISYENGDNIEGTYSMVVDNATLAGSPGPHLYSHGAGQPFAVHAVYSATVDVVYETTRLYYETTVAVVPEGSDG